MTVVGFVDVAKAKDHKAIVHSAACSSLGKMLVKYCKQEGVTLINIVRRDEQVKTLESIGAEYILNSSSETFEADLKELTHKLEASAYFDPICGTFTATVMRNMPAKSVAYVYGCLTGQDASMSAIDFIFYQKTLSSFWLGPFLGSKTADEKKAIFGAVITDLATGGKIFGSDVVKTYPLEEFQTALDECNKVASEGKVLIKPHD